MIIISQKEKNIFSFLVLPNNLLKYPPSALECVSFDDFFFFDELDKCNTRNSQILLLFLRLSFELNT